MAEQQQPKTEVSPRVATQTPTAAKRPFVEPKLTWIEPELRQQGTLTAAAQSGGFFGSFSP